MAKATPETRLESQKFYRITQSAYQIGLFGHAGAIFLFWYLEVPEMVLVNIFFSCPAFATALLLNRKEHYNAAFALAFLELLLHQILATYYLGWAIGAHYWLIYLAGLSFFNANWSRFTQFSLLFIVCISFMAIFLFMQEGIYAVDESVRYSSILSNGITTIVIISLLINYYAQATLKSEKGLIREQERTKNLLVKIESLFGQQISHKIAQQLISSEEEIKATNFEATIMFLDIRDFTLFADSREPSEVAAFQNIVFADLIGIVLKNNGTVLQLLGDGLMAVFGAPVEDRDHATNAVNSGFEILKRINELSDEGQIPKIRLGIGLNSGNVIAGNIGNDQRKAYSLTGKNVIIAARIETLNKQYQSQFLISQSTFQLIDHSSIPSEDLGAVNLKGIESPVRIFKLS